MKLNKGVRYQLVIILFIAATLNLFYLIYNSVFVITDCCAATHTRRCCKEEDDACFI